MAWLVTNAQETIFSYRNFNQKDGLNTKTIYKMAQDKMGFLWFGSAIGLYRYDGHSFKLIKNTSKDKNNTIANLLIEVKYDSTHNRLWLSSLTDVQYFDLYQYTFHKLSPGQDTIFSMEYAEKNIHIVDKRRIWISMLGKIIEYDILKKSFLDITQKLNLPKDYSTNFTVFDSYDEKKSFLVFPNYLLLVDHETYSTQILLKANNEVFMQVWHDEKDSTIYIAGNNCLMIYNEKTKLSKKVYFKYNLNNNRSFNHNINSFTPFDDSTLLLSGMGGHILFHKNDGTHKHYPQQEGEYQNKVGASFHFIDREGSLWRTSIHHYCNVLYRQNRNLIKTAPLQNKNLVNIEPYKTILVDGDTLVFCGSGITGIGILNAANGRYSILENNKNPSPFVNDVIKNGSHRILTADRLNINFWDLKSKKVSPLKFNIDGKYTNIAGALYILKCGKDKLVAVTESDMFLLSLPDYIGKVWKIKSLHKDFVKTVYLDLKPVRFDDDKILFTAASGLYFYDLVNEEFLKYPLPVKTGEREITNITDFLIDPNKNWWISTTKTGLYKYQPVNKSIINYNSENSCLNNDYVSYLNLDKYQRLWVSTPEKNILLDINDGNCLSAISEVEGIGGTGYHNRIQEGKDIMTFNYYPFIVIKDFTKDIINKFISQSYITSFKINGKETLHVPIAQDTSFVLGADENSIHIEFTNLCFNNGHQNQYRYKLEGLDNGWITSGTHYVNYIRLPSGNFKFLLQASNNEGIWHPHIQEISIRVKPVFYKTWWFLLLGIVIVTTVIYTFYLQRISKIRSEEALKRKFEKQISEIEMKALRAQMNPHFIFNSLNSIQKFIFDRDEYAASQYLTKFSRLIRMILDHSDQDFISLSEEVDLLNLYIEMEALRFDKSFDYHIEVDPSIPLDTRLPSMIIQPHIENAIWHGLLHLSPNVHDKEFRKGKLLVTFKQSNADLLIITIEDNGVGRQKAKEYKSKQILKKKSYGSGISEERIKIFNRMHGINTSFNVVDLVDKNNEGIGTRVEIILAYRHE